MVILLKNYFLLAEFNIDSVYLLRLQNLSISKSYGFIALFNFQRSLLKSRDSSFFYLSLIALHWEAQRSHNLASIFSFVKSFFEDFSNFFHRTLGTDHRFQRHEVKYSTKFSFVKSVFEDFSNFSQSTIFNFIH